MSPARMALDCEEGTKVRFQSERNCGRSAGSNAGATSARTISQRMSEPSTAARRRAAMEAGACYGSFSKTSSSTEVSTAVTIANQAQVIIGVGPVGQLAATAPLLKYIRFDFFPRHEHTCLALHFEYGSRTQAKGLTRFLRNADFAVILNNGTHVIKIDNPAFKSICEFSG